VFSKKKKINNRKYLDNPIGFRLGNFLQSDFLEWNKKEEFSSYIKKTFEKNSVYKKKRCVKILPNVLKNKIFGKTSP